MHGPRKFYQCGPWQLFLSINVFHRGQYRPLSRSNWTWWVLRGGCTRIPKETYCHLWFSMGGSGTPVSPSRFSHAVISVTASELRVRLARCETGLSPPVKYFYWPFQGGTSFGDHLCYLCLVFVMLLRLFIAALWSPEGKAFKGWPLGSCL